jgi:NAD(P)H-dependent FMN reductase
MPSSPSLNIGILLGSVRTNNNNNGIAQWVQHQLDALLSSEAAQSGKTTLIPLTTYPLPLGPLYEDIIPQAVRPESTSEDGTRVLAYPSQRTKDFSRIIQSLDGLVIVTPQYNWSIPGELKNAIDHLFHEWADLPIATVTYGGRGGDKVSEALRMIIHGIRAKEVSVGKVMLVLPRESHIVGQDRIRGDEDLLERYDEVLKEEMGKLVSAARDRKGVGQGK